MFALRIPIAIPVPSHVSAPKPLVLAAHVACLVIGIKYRQRHG